MKRLKLWMIPCGMLLLTTGCSRLFAPRIEPHPDAPLLVTRTFAGFAETAVYDKERNEMLPAGWAWMGRYDGWTLHKFDWNTRIDAEAATRGQTGDGLE